MAEMSTGSEAVASLAKAAYWDEVREDGHPWSSERDAFEDDYAQGYARSFGAAPV